MSAFLLFLLFFSKIVLAQTEHEDFVRKHLAELRHPAEQYLGGSKDSEVAVMAEWLKVIDILHERAKKTRSPQVDGRPFHHEGGGVMIADFRPNEDLATNLNTGIFSTRYLKERLTVVIRFSNGVGKNQHDLIPDVRGATVVFLLHDPSQPLENQKISIVSQPMTNGPAGNTLIGEDVGKFVTFAEHMSKPGLLAKAKLLAFLLRNPDVRKPVVQASFRNYPIESRLLVEYGSGHAYSLSDGSAYKAKINLHYGKGGYSPLSQTLWDNHWDASPLRGLKTFTQNINSPDYLRDDVYAWISNGELAFDLSIQRESKTTSPEDLTKLIEQSALLWDTSSHPFEKAGRISGFRQLRNPELELIMDTLSLGPNLFSIDHQPLGIAGRARSVLYQYSASKRGATDPASDAGQKALRYILRQAESLSRSNPNPLHIDCPSAFR